MNGTERAPRLLALDDDVDIGAIVGAVAAKAGFDGTVTTSAAEFQRLVEAREPDVIVLDLQMPGMDGIELLRWLSDRKVAALIVLLTGMDARTISAAEQFAVRSGLNVLTTVQKPFVPDDLAERLSRAKARCRPLRAEDLSQALANRELGLVYQPVLRRYADGWDVDGVEALLRWEHPERGTLTPDSFLNLGEDRGLHLSLTDFVIQESLQQAKGWRASRRSLGLRVNLSAALLTDVEFPDRLDVALAEHEIPSDSVTLELNETAMLDEHPETFDILTRLRLKEVRLAIDDFGIGYSSLTQLFRMPFSEMKIDRSLIARIPDSKEARITVEAMIDLAHKLGLDVCGEGVESAESLQFLYEAGCDAAQGYLISPPIASRRVPDLVERWRSGSVDLTIRHSVAAGSAR